MFEQDEPIYLCYSCDAEFSVEALTDEEIPSYCPFCGSNLDYDEEEDLDEEE